MTRLNLSAKLAFILCLFLGSWTAAAQAGQWSVTRNGEILEIAYGENSNFPQFAALHLDSGYFRLTFASDGGWGTSVILMPAFWENGKAGEVYHQGAAVSCSWSVQDKDLRLSLSGTIAGLSVSGEALLSPPANDQITARVSMTCQGSVNLSPRPGETFKPVMLSSMRVSDTQWDASQAFVDDQTYDLPASGFIIDPAVSGKRWGLRGGDSSWKRNAPSVEVTLDEYSSVTGWVSESDDPNQDNVGLWAATDSLLHSWSYSLKAAP